MTHHGNAHAPRPEDRNRGHEGAEPSPNPTGQTPCFASSAGIPPTPDRDAQVWITAARDPTIAALLESIYSDAAADIARRGPACWASGRCCNFGKSGHRLYTTGLEAAYTVVHLNASNPTLSANALAESLSRGGCPFQVNNLCGVHAIKPLSCRLYFCDRSAQAWQHELSERLLERLKRLHDTHQVPYRYAEWRQLLALFC